MHTFSNNENSISIFNALFPQVAKAMTNYLETHQTESQYQSSLYIKLVLFRWTTSVLIFFIITPFTEIITYGTNGLLERINSQFISDLTVTNGLALLDIVSSIGSIEPAHCCCGIVLTYIFDANYFHRYPIRF